MKRNLVSAAVIAVIIGMFGAVLVSITTATYSSTSPITGESEFLHGLNAVQSLIDNFGVFAFVKLVLGYTAFLIPIVFVGCALQTFWLRRVIH